MSLESLVKGIVGHRRAQPGAEVPLRLGGLSEQIVNDVGLGKYFEMVRKGFVFSTFAKAVTVAATHNSPIAANTATPVVGIGNVSENKAAVLLRVGFQTTSGTPAGGQVVLNIQPNGADRITAAATGSIFNHLPMSGISPQGSQMRPLNNIALGGWIATPDAVQELMLVGGATAAAAAGNGGPGVLGEDLGGLIIIPPNCLCALMAGSGAGTSWIVNASLTWAEIDWPFLLD